MKQVAVNITQIERGYLTVEVARCGVRVKTYWLREATGSGNWVLFDEACGIASVFSDQYDALESLCVENFISSER